MSRHPDASDWNWAQIRALVAWRGEVTIYHAATDAGYRQQIARYAADHGLKVRALDRTTLVVEL